MKRSRVGLRSLMMGATIALGVMAIAVSSALMLLTTKLHAANDVLRDSVASVRIAQQAEIELLLHDRTPDDVVRLDAETTLRRLLLEAHQHVNSPREEWSLELAHSTVISYLDAATEPTVAPSARARLLQASYRALDNLVDLNVAQADAAEAKAARWDTAGNVIGISASTLMVSTVIAVALWVRRAVLRPVLSLSEAMARFGAGALEARTSEHGAIEVARLSEQFNAMASRLVRQRQDRLSYLAGIAHDLRTPLSALALATDLEVAQRQVARLNRMVGDLLETARIEAGQLSLKLGTHDLRDVARTVHDLFAGTSPPHRLDLVLPDEPLHVRCDEMRIEQTLTNLVSNAIKYSPRGGTIQIAACRDGDQARIAVSDPGVGINEAELAQLWEPFRRASSTREAIPGVGLGLSIAKRIVEAHGGTIDVTSTPGVGSTFAISLPALRTGSLVG